MTAYPILRLKMRTGRSLMDSDVGDDLLEAFARSNPRVDPLVNLQAAVGLLQLESIDAFNRSARRNAGILSGNLRGIQNLGFPEEDGGEHIFVYYPLTVEPELRDSLRRYLLKHGIDTKTTDMSDCSLLEPFRDRADLPGRQAEPKEASVLEVCVYPVISEKSIRRLARVLRRWEPKK